MHGEQSECFTRLATQPESHRFVLSEQRSRGCEAFSGPVVSGVDEQWLLAEFPRVTGRGKSRGEVILDAPGLTLELQLNFG